MLVQTLNQTDPFVGAANLWPATAAFEVQALIRVGDVANDAFDKAIMAQCDTFAGATAGWGIGFRSGILTAFVVDNIGETAAVLDFATEAPSQGQLMHVGFTYADGGNLTLFVNGSSVDVVAMGGATFVNAAVAPWVGAEDAAGSNPAEDLFEVVSLLYSSSLNVGPSECFRDGVEFGYFNPTAAGNGTADATHLYNARYSAQKNSLNFVGANASAAAVLINQGTTQNAAETVGNLTGLTTGTVEVSSLPLRVG